MMCLSLEYKLPEGRNPCLFLLRAGSSAVRTMPSTQQTLNRCLLNYCHFLKVEMHTRCHFFFFLILHYGLFLLFYSLSAFCRACCLSVQVIILACIYYTFFIVVVQLLSHRSKEKLLKTVTNSL